MFQGRVEIAQLAMRSEEHQRSPPDPPRHSGHHFLHLPVEILMLGPGKVRGQAYERLVEEVEGRWQDELFDIRAESDPRPEVVEAPPHRKSRRREHR